MPPALINDCWPVFGHFRLNEDRCRNPYDLVCSGPIHSCEGFSLKEKTGFSDRMFAISCSLNADCRICLRSSAGYPATVPRPSVDDRFPCHRAPSLGHAILLLSGGLEDRICCLRTLTSSLRNVSRFSRFRPCQYLSTLPPNPQSSSVL